jgi:hypothetical protein
LAIVRFNILEGFDSGYVGVEACGGSGGMADF